MADRHDQTEKQDRLRQTGTLNRAPGNVTDPMFTTGDFFDARDLLQVRYEMSGWFDWGKPPSHRRRRASESPAPPASAWSGRSTTAGCRG